MYSSKRKLRIGYYTEDGELPLFPGCERAVMEAKSLLEQIGHEVSNACTIVKEIYSIIL